MEFNTNIPLEDLFNKPEYSDLTIKLSGGHELHVHKLVVCAGNDYFLKLCGPVSHFAESKQDTIELKDDDPTALEHVLNYLYGIKSPYSDQWRYWLNIHVTADKYLIPQLSAKGSRIFCRLARECTSVDEIFDIMETCRTGLRHEDVFVRLGAELRGKNLSKLLSNARFRAQLDSDGMDALW